MLGILSQTLRIASRTNPPIRRQWDAPLHWTKPEARRDRS